jgi:hypothetical protein
LQLSEKSLPPGFPTILKNPSMKVVEKGLNVVLECEAAGEPQVSLQLIITILCVDPEGAMYICQFVCY